MRRLWVEDLWNTYRRARPKRGRHDAPFEVKDLRDKHEALRLFCVAAGGCKRSRSRLVAFDTEIA
jgi:hypothetical protein